MSAPRPSGRAQIQPAFCMRTLAISSRVGRAGGHGCAAVTACVATPRSWRGHPITARLARPVPASSAAWCSSDPRAGRPSGNHLGATRDCPTPRVAGAPWPRSSPAPPTRLRSARSRLSTPLPPASDGPRRRPHVGRYPRNVRRRTPDAIRCSSAARSACVNGSPAGVGTMRSVSLRQISSSASPHTGAIITIPGPPPYGASSTDRCTSWVHRRRSCTASCTMPASMALPGSDCRSGSR